MVRYLVLIYTYYCGWFSVNSTQLYYTREYRYSYLLGNILQVIVAAMHGGCNYLAVQVHYFIWQGNAISGHNTYSLLLGDGQQVIIIAMHGGCN